jgi:hypothetical protein
MMPIAALARCFSKSQRNLNSSPLLTADQHRVIMAMGINMAMILIVAM